MCKKMKNTTAIKIIIILSFFIMPSIVSARTFNPNYIISDEEILDHKAMTLDEIQKFLIRKGSFLSSYRSPDYNGNIISASEIIYNAAANNFDCTGIKEITSSSTLADRMAKCLKIRLNPKFLIVLLQKEMSLIEDSSPTQRQLDWAAGYGCPDGGGCDNYWKGFGKQVNSAALQFYDYMANPQSYKYKAGQTYIFSNPYGTIKNEPMQVTPLNQATAALYNYTPHVYNGNYNFFNIWQRYFTKSYPDGSLLQAKGEQVVWLIENGYRRPFLSKGALTSRFDIKKVILVNKSDLDKYDQGKAIRFSQYSIVRTPKGAIYLLIDDKRRGFKNMEAFRKIGINPEEVIDVSWDDIADYAEIEPITTTSTYPIGALLQNKKTGGIYWVINGTKSPILDRVFLKTTFKNRKPIQVKPDELEKYTTVDPYLYKNGELLSSQSSSAVYLISGGLRHAINSAEIFLEMGYKWQNVIQVPDKILERYEEGDPIIDSSGI